MKLLATATLAIGLLGTSAFAAGGRGTTFEPVRKAPAVSKTVIKSTPVDVNQKMPRTVKFGYLNR